MYILGTPHGLYLLTSCFTSRHGETSGKVEGRRVKDSANRVGMSSRGAGNLFLSLANRY